METQKNVFYNVMLAVSQVLFPLITFPYLARTLGPEHVGLLNFAESFARYFVLVAAFGIPIYGVREIAKSQKDKVALTKIFIEIFLINLIATMVLSLFFVGCILYVGKLASEPALYYWSLLFFILQLFVFEWFFIGLNQFKFIAFRFFIIRLFFISAVFILIKSQADYLKYMQMQVGLSALLAFINFRYLAKYIKINKSTFQQLNLKKHIKPLLLLFLTIFSISVYLQLDTVILGFLADNESVGYYSSALKLNKLIIAVLAAISAAMFPKMITLFQENKMDEFNEMIKNCFYVIISLALPTMLLVYVMAPEIIYILFGSNFSRAILPLQITAPIILIVSLSTIFGFQILSALSKDRAILISSIFGMVMSVLLSIALVKAYKEIGEAIAILITEITVCASFLYFASKYFNFNGFAKIVLQQVMSLIPYIIIVYAIKYTTQHALLKIVAVVFLSLVWFSIFHLLILKNGLLKNQLMKIINKNGFGASI